jgi:hypothetical protein
MSGVTAGSATLMFLLYGPQLAAGFFFARPAFWSSTIHYETYVSCQVFWRCLEWLLIDKNNTWRRTGETNGARHPREPIASIRWQSSLLIPEQTYISGR